ncbi:MAG: NfeD family protein [Pseudomonadota bacterium]
MANWILWCIAAGLILIFEIFTGTFYLLMISFGLAAGAAASALGFSFEMQIVVAAVVGIVATALLRHSKWGKINKTNAARDPNVNLDIGQSIVVREWSNEVGGKSTARTMYRGAMWDVELAPGAEKNGSDAGTFVIQEIRGSHLIVSRHNV